jgi:hypothetical protein
MHLCNKKGHKQKILKIPFSLLVLGLYKKREFVYFDFVLLFSFYIWGYRGYRLFIVVFIGFL